MAGLSHHCTPPRHCMHPLKGTFHNEVLRPCTPSHSKTYLPTQAKLPTSFSRSKQSLRKCHAVCPAAFFIPADGGCAHRTCCVPILDAAGAVIPCSSFSLFLEYSLPGRSSGCDASHTAPTTYTLQWVRAEPNHRLSACPPVLVCMSIASSHMLSYYASST